MMNKIKTILLISNIFSFNVYAQHPLDNVPAKYDQNKNGILDIGQEEKVYLIHFRNKDLAKFDKDLNGYLNGNEVIKYNEWLSRYLQDDLKDAKDRRDVASAPISVKPENKKPVVSPIEIEEKKGVIVKSGVLLREAYAVSSILSQAIKTDAKSLKSVKPALGSYTRNNETDTDQLSLSGAISTYRKWSFRGKERPIPNLHSSALSLGLIFDKTDSSGDESNETNVLTLKSDLDLSFENWPVFDKHFITASAGVASDFDLDAILLTSQLRWQPVKNSFAIGVAFSIGDLPISFRWQPSLSFDYQHVADAGDQMQLKDNEDYLFFGPRINANIFFDFEPLSRTFLSFDYSYYEGLDGPVDHFDYFETSANFPIDKENHFLFTVKYREGDLPTTRQPVDEVTVGIGVRY